MATRNAESYTLIANADLTGKEGCFGKTTSGKAAICSVLGEQSDFVIWAGGIAGTAIDCMPSVGRKVPVKIGAVAVVAGAELTPDANGLAKTAVSTNYVRCKAIVAGNAGETIETEWVDAYVKP